VSSSRLGAALGDLALASFGMYADDLASAASRAAATLGGEATMLLVDLDQVVLRSLDDPAVADLPVETPGPGPALAYREERVVVDVDSAGGGRRLWVPLKDSAERVGVLAVRDGGDVPDDEWLALASFLGELVVSKSAYGDAITLRRRTRPVSLAAEMRWTMLPPLTFTAPDLAVSGTLTPSYGIAGDAFDYAVTARRASVSVLDAMGHGLEAARMANLAISSYRNSRRLGAGPLETLVAMDGAIAESFGDFRFVTSLVAELDLEDGELTLVSAGHPPPLLLRDGAVEPLDCPPGRPAGLGGTRPPPRTVTLRPGDGVLLYTDGIVEARSPAGEPFGEERLAEVLAATADRGLPIAEVVRLLVGSVQAHSGGRNDDDATLVLVRWRATLN
jgi:hypothetical protein